MATSFYNGYLIISVGHQDKSSKRWSATVDISNQVPIRPIKTIQIGDEFQTKVEAESDGVLKAREWIEKHSRMK